MGLAHWLMIAGALLVLVGFIGAVLQRNARVAADPVPMQDRETGKRTESLPNLLPTKMSRP
jgi:hypothetical protein